MRVNLFHERIHIQHPTAVPHQHRRRRRGGGSLRCRRLRCHRDDRVLIGRSRHGHEGRPRRQDHQQLHRQSSPSQQHHDGCMYVEYGKKSEMCFECTNTHSTEPSTFLRGTTNAEPPTGQVNNEGPNNARGGPGQKLFIFPLLNYSLVLIQ
jgi:hypothetical protein